MKCYHCGATLTQHDFCTACKSDVRQYKLIIEASNRKYNEGLEKAQVRDLSGAAAALRQCLKLNKEHVDAHNLLGLIYFETGEVVSALGEWIISKNLQPEKNLAEDYIERLQNNRGKLENYNQIIHKYNKALDLCHQGSDDLAIIQLKKVVSMNPKYVKAHLLLALLFIEQEAYDKAHALLKHIIQVDRGNTQAQRYLREISKINKQKNGNAKSKVTGKDKDSIVRYERDNEIIIQPAEVIEPNTGKGVIAGFVIGFLLGAAILFFLVLPGRIQSVRAELESSIRVANEEKEAQNATIASLENQVDMLISEKDSVIAQYGDLYRENGKEELIRALLNAVQTHLSTPEDIENLKKYMDVCVQNEIYYTENSNSILGLYSGLKTTVSPVLAEHHYSLGVTAYDAKDYETAVKELEFAVLYYDSNADSLLYLGNAYKANGDTEKAKEVYNDILTRFANTNQARQASQALNGM